jgi:hypothetical protein
VAWLKGELQLLGGSDRFHLCVGGQKIAFHCGDPLELKRNGCWERGRVEYSDRLGWYWTNNRRDLRLLAGDQVRVWDGLTWPPPERTGPER